MNDAAAKTPTNAGSQRVWLPLGIALSFPLLVAAVRLTTRWHLPFSQCWLRKFTGVPCPTCGCTRSLLAWAQWDLAQAFLFNPLFFLACAGVLAWCLVATAEKAFGRVWLSSWRSRWKARLLWRMAIALVVLNWLYLCLRLPK